VKVRTRRIAGLSVEAEEQCAGRESDQNLKVPSGRPPRRHPYFMIKIDDGHGQDLIHGRGRSSAAWAFIPAWRFELVAGEPSLSVFSIRSNQGRFPYDEAPRPKSELMARLRAAITAGEIIDVLCDLGRARRGGAEELAYLADHPDPHVRDTPRRSPEGVLRPPSATTPRATTAQRLIGGQSRHPLIDTAARGPHTGPRSAHNAASQRRRSVRALLCRV